MNNQDYMLEMKGISKYFPGIKALSNVDFDLRRGEVMGLLGENGAGKSTLMKVLLGMYIPEEGSIQFKGEPYTVKSPHDALKKGVSMIHQEISLVQTMTVSENIWFGREDKYKKFGLLNVKQRNKDAAALLQKIGIDTIDPNALVSSLSIAHMQLVEIIRAVSYDADIIIMDEPTSALTDVEIDILYNIINQLKQAGVSIVFISHKLEEVLKICDRSVVLRDGQYIETINIEDANVDKLITSIVGRELTDVYPEHTAEIGDVVFEVSNFNSAGTFSDISFSVRQGEVLGFGGLIGAGRTEIMQSIFGVDPYDSGEIRVNGVPIVVKKVNDAIEHGLAMINEDRLRKGVLHSLSVRENISLAYLNTITKGIFVNADQEKKDVERVVDLLSVKLSNHNQMISSLSGGNQQKAILGRWLLTKPKVLILDEPTRGIDVGSKSEIYRLINQLATQGLAIILVSSELPELMGVSDRINVIRNGRIVAEFQREEFDQESIMKKAFGA